MDWKVSVIIPTYKRAEYLSRAIDSVLSQTYENVEIIVVDDNGSESEYQAATGAMMQGLYGGNEKVVYIQNPENLGGAHSRNKGAGIATGEYLCFLDDDDIFLPEKIEHQLRYMTQNGIEMCFTDIKMYDQNDKVVDARDHSRYVKSTQNSELLKYHLMHHLTPTDTYMFLRSAFLKTEGFRQRTVSQEFMLMLASIEDGLKIGYLHEVTAVQYIHDQGRISSAKGRVEGDKALYDIKKSYFHLLSHKEKQYINFRYNAVFGFYYLRNKDIFKGAAYIAKAFLISPPFFVAEGFDMVTRLKA